MIRVGENVIDGVPVEVVRKRLRRISLRVTAEGRVVLSVPDRWATLREGEAFLKTKWKWVVKTREKALSCPASSLPPVSEDELSALKTRLAELNESWRVRLSEAPFDWKVRRVKSMWGCCHWLKRRVTYNLELARAPRELVEYVVVHELTHFQAHDHGPRFKALMDLRLPDWKSRRRSLNARDWIRTERPPKVPQRLIQSEFAF